MSADNPEVEAAIRARLEAGDRAEAATLLLEGYGREIFGFLTSHVRDVTAASEVFSDFTEDLWRGLETFEQRGSARAWAYAIARHAASHHFRGVKRQRKRVVPLSSASRLSKIAAKIRTETLLEHRTSAKRKITALRDSLPEDDQTLLVLRVNRGLDWREIAQVLLYEGKPLTDAALKREAARLRKRFQLVKDRLRKMAAAEGLLEGESG